MSEVCLPASLLPVANPLRSFDGNYLFSRDVYGLHCLDWMVKNLEPEIKAGLVSVGLDFITAKPEVWHRTNQLNARLRAVYPNLIDSDLFEARLAEAVPFAVACILADGTFALTVAVDVDLRSDLVDSIFRVEPRHAQAHVADRISPYDKALVCKHLDLVSDPLVRLANTYRRSQNGK